MIINETKNTYEDFTYMFKKAKYAPMIVLRRLILVIAGLYFLAEAMNLIQKNMKYFVYLSAGGSLDKTGILFVLFLVFLFVMGIAAIIFNFFYLKFGVYMGYKRKYSKWSPRHMEFDDDTLEISFEENGIKSNTAISYASIGSYTRYNNAVYIAVKIDGKKANKYICVHDDSYISGNVDELIKLLNDKGIVCI